MIKSRKEYVPTYEWEKDFTPTNLGYFDVRGCLRARLIVAMDIAMRELGKDDYYKWRQDGGFGCLAPCQSKAVKLRAAKDLIKYEAAMKSDPARAHDILSTFPCLTGGSECDTLIAIAESEAIQRGVQ